MRKFVFILMLCASMVQSCSKTTEVSIKQLTIVYTGNIGGRKNPCGCKPPLGGFARRSTVINSMRNLYENIFVIDSGAVMYPHNFLVPPYDYILRLDGHVSIQAVDAIGIDAVNVSSYDLSNSADSLLAIDKTTSFPWLSANLTWRDSGELIFTPHILTTKGDIRIGVFGIMADNFMGTTLYNEDSPLKVLDPVKTAQEEVSKLREESDLVIALAQMSFNETVEICEKVSGIDIIVHSHNGYHNPSSDHKAFSPTKKGNTLIIRCPDGGRVIGYLDLEMVNNSPDFTETKENPYRIASSSEDENAARAPGSTYINYFIDLGPGMKSDAAIQAGLDAVDGTIKAYKDSLGI